ncbi:MAG: hypothetical protein AAB515_01420 [Patescibacteria group bacterium]
MKKIGTTRYTKNKPIGLRSARVRAKSTTPKKVVPQKHFGVVQAVRSRPRLTQAQRLQHQTLRMLALRRHRAQVRAAVALKLFFQRTLLQSAGMLAIVAVFGFGFLGHAQSTSRSYNISPTACTGWQDAGKATTLDLLGSSDVGSFSASNSASIASRKSADAPVGEPILKCRGFALPDDFPTGVDVRNIDLQVSLGGLGNAESVDALVIESSLDGSQWSTLESFFLTEDTSNASNGGYRTYPFPALNQDNLSSLQVRVRFASVPTEKTVRAYVDGMALHVAVRQVVSAEALNLPANVVQVEKHDVPTNEEPVVKVEVQKQARLKFLGFKDTKRTVDEVQVTTPEGTVQVASFDVQNVTEGSSTYAKLNIHTDKFTKPGKYTAQVTVLQDNKLAIVTTEFTWGVLVINMNRSVYWPGETVQFGMGVLDPEGHTLCDAKLVLTVVAPDGTKSVQTTEQEKDGVKRSATCGPDNVTDVADYSAEYETFDEGSYAVTLTAKTASGEYTITDTVVVDAVIPFAISRRGSMRIYPPAAYTMALDVRPQKDFTGVVEDYVPPSFEILNVSDGGKIIKSQQRTTIRWQVDWVARTTHTLTYRYDAPDISPELFRLGPVRVASSTEALPVLRSSSATEGGAKVEDYQESRQWQIASDDLQILPRILQTEGRADHRLLRTRPSPADSPNQKSATIDEPRRTVTQTRIELPKNGFVNALKICATEAADGSCTAWEPLDVPFTNTGDSIIFETSTLGKIAAFDDAVQPNVAELRKRYSGDRRMPEVPTERTADSVDFRKSENENIRVQSANYLNYFDGTAYQPLPNIPPPGEILVSTAPADGRQLYVELPEWAVLSVSADGQVINVADKRGTNLWFFETPYFFQPDRRPFLKLSVKNAELTSEEIHQVYPDGIVTGLPDADSGLMRECTRKTCVDEALITRSKFVLDGTKVYVQIPTGLQYPQVLVDDIDTGSTNSRDSHMRLSLPTRGYGSCTYLHAGRILDDAVYNYRPVMDWTLTSGSGTITNIDLYLYRYDVSTYSGGNSATSRSYELHELTQAFTEGSVCDTAVGSTGVTWNRYDGTNNWASAGGDYSGTIVDSTALTGNGTADAWYTWTLNGSGATNSIAGLTWGSAVDFVLFNPSGYVASGNNLDHFASKEFTGTGSDPYIEITYFTSITVSGVAYTNESGSTLNSSGGSIKLVNSTTGSTFSDADGTDGSGNWSITGVTVPTVGDILTIWINGATADGSLVLKYGSTCTGYLNCTGLSIYQNRTIFRNEHTGSVTNANVSSCDNDTGTNCTDTEIGFTSNSGTLTVSSGIELHIWTGDTFDPGGTVTTNATGGDLHLDDSATVTLGNATNAIGRDVIVDTGATLNINADTTVSGGDITNAGTGVITTTSGVPTVTVSGTGSIGGVSGSTTFYNLTLSGTPTFASNFTINNNLTLPASVTHGSNTITMVGTAGSLVGGGATIYALTIDPSSTGTITLSTSDLTVANTLTIASNDTLSIGSGRTLTHTGATLTWGNSSSTISGAGTLAFTDASGGPGTSGTLNANVRYVATSGNIASTTLDARIYGGLLEVYSNSTTARTVTLASGTYDIASSLHVIADGASPGNVTLTGTTNNPTINISDGLDFTGTGTSSEVIQSGTGTWTMSGIVDFTGGTYTATSGNTLLMQTSANGSSCAESSPTFYGAGNTFYNIDFHSNPGAKAHCAGSSFTVSNQFSVSNSDFLGIDTGVTITVTGSPNIVNSGTIGDAGTLRFTDTAGGPGTGGTISCVTRFDASAGNIASTTLDARTYNGRVELYNNAASSPTFTLASGTYTLSGTSSHLYLIADGPDFESVLTLSGTTNNPTITIGGNLDFTGTGAEAEAIASGSGTWTVSGNVDLSGGSYSGSTNNTLVMNGSAKTLTSSGSLYNVTLSGSITLANANHYIDGNLDFTGGTITAGSSTVQMRGTGKTIVGAGQTLNNLTITPSGSGNVTLQTSDLTVAGTLSITSADDLIVDTSRTLTHTGTTLTLSGTLSGPGRYTYRSTTAFPTGGTLASGIILRFDANGGNQTMSQRTDYQLVEVDNSSTTAGRTLAVGTAGSQTITLAGKLELLNSGTGSSTTIVDLNTNDPTFTVGGNTTIAADTTLTAPSGGALNLKGDYANSGTFTDSGGTVTLNGTGQQTLSATMTGSSDFNVLTITNINGTYTNDSCGTPSAYGVIFAASVTTATLNIATAGVKVQFLAGSTVTVSTTLNLQGGVGNRVVLRSSTTSVWTLAAPVTQTVTYVDVSYSTATGNTVIATDGTSKDCANNTNWTFPTGIDVAGTSNSSGGTVRVAVNSSLQAQTTTLAATWTITGVSVSSGDKVTVYVESAVDAAETTGVTKYDGTGNIGGLALDTNVLTVGSDDNASLVLTDLGLYDNDQSEDIMHTANVSVLTVDGLGGYSTEQLTMKASNTLTIGTTETLATHHLSNAGTLVGTGSATFDVFGNWTNSSTFTHNTTTVNFKSTGTGKTINNGASSFYNVIFNGSGGAWSPLTNTMTVTNDLTMTAGTFDTATGTASVTVNGNVQCGASCGTITMNSAGSNTFTQSVAASKSFGTNVAVATNWTFYNLTFTASSGTPTITFNSTGTGQTIVANTLTTTNSGTSLVVDNETNDRIIDANGAVTIGSGTTLQASSTAAFTVAGNWTNNGDFTDGTGTVTLDGASQQTVDGQLTGASDRFYNLTITNASGSDPVSSPSVIFAAAADTANTFNASTASTKLRFLASGTYTLQHLTLNGQATGTRVALRSSTGGTQWNVNVAGTRAVTYTEVKDSNACGQAPDIDASDGTSHDIGGNSCWNIHTLTFAINDVAVGFGTLSSSAARWASADATGSGSAVAAHTLAITTSAFEGYALTYNGATLTGPETITAATFTGDADGTPGSKQFAMGITTSGSGTIPSAYQQASNNYSFVPSTTTPLLTKTTATTTTETASVYYMCNIATITQPGTYTTAVTYIVTGTF